MTQHNPLEFATALGAKLANRQRHVCFCRRVRIIGRGGLVLMRQVQTYLSEHHGPIKVTGSTTTLCGADK